MTVRTQQRRCYACGAEFEPEAIPMQGSYRGESSKRMYMPAAVQTWCPKGHKVQVMVALPEDLGQ